jgi:hypothetical protein
VEGGGMCFNNKITDVEILASILQNNINSCSLKNKLCVLMILENIGMNN